MFTRRHEGTKARSQVKLGNEFKKENVFLRAFVPSCLRVKNKKTWGAARLSSLVFAFLTCASLQGMGEETPKNGYVPDAAPAEKIAVAVWEPIYGAEKRAKTCRVSLSHGVWKVTGFLKEDKVQYLANGTWVVSNSQFTPWLLAEIAKEDGKILRVSYVK